MIRYGTEFLKQNFLQLLQLMNDSGQQGVIKRSFLYTSMFIQARRLSSTLFTQEYFLEFIPFH